MSTTSKFRIVSAVLAVSALACAKVSSTPPPTAGAAGIGGSGAGGAGGGGSPGTGGAAAGGGINIVGTGGGAGTGEVLPPPLTDFPTDPIFVDPTIPTNAPALFGADGSAGSAPCITSPEASTLMPRNWLRPRFDYVPTRSEN